jgi:hypothetical protein
MPWLLIVKVANMKRSVLGFLGLFLMFSVQASATTFSSNTTQTTLVELYTSQGCSSCPPAERWLNGLVEHPDLWTGFIPLAFHVDYWDRLGWKDIYAKPEHTRRQYQYQKDGNVRVVYTPGFFANGKEWRGWSNWFETSMPASTKEVGVLTLEMNGNQISAAFDNEKRSARVLNVAILGFDIKTAIKAGENGGEELPQEFVVLGNSQAISTNGQWQLSLPSVSNKANKYALVGWVSDDDNQAPIQATGGWLPNEVIR